MLDLSSEEDLDEYKLCGFLCIVLSVASPHECPHSDASLPLGTRCHLHGTGHAAYFRASNGVELYPVGSTAVNAALIPECESKSSANERDMRSRRKRSIGMVHGSVSVVYQLHVLVSYKCLKVVSRVIKVEKGECGDTRAVVLMDVHLPIALWSGWQFPRSGSVAGSFFKHISHDWKKRCSLLETNVISGQDDHCSEDDVWNVSSCHVLECKLHRQTFHSSNKKLFKLNEIFKSLPGLARTGRTDCSRMMPALATDITGIWELSDDILINILSVLDPMELVQVSATCRHLRLLAMPVMPCMNLKLFPHQQTAVDWMLWRERNAELFPHPLYKEISTEDGFAFYINIISGEILTGVAPVVRDFHGGMFCDEPGLGKTITALSLILKTQGTLADPPDEAEVIWCLHSTDQKCGYYELDSNSAIRANTCLGRNGVSRRRQLSLDKVAPRTPKISPSRKKSNSKGPVAPTLNFFGSKEVASSSALCSTAAAGLVRCPRGVGHTKRNLIFSYDKSSLVASKRTKVVKAFSSTSNHGGHIFLENHLELPHEVNAGKRTRIPARMYDETKENWVQCDSCHKWRKLATEAYADPTVAWFCRMNSNPSYQSCDSPEEYWDHHQHITCLPGFYSKEEMGGKEENVAFFTNILKEHYALMESETKKAVIWLASLSPEKLSEMGTIGLVPTLCATRTVSTGNGCSYYKLFQAFGLLKRSVKGICRWYYPQHIGNLVFDLEALGIALGRPLDSLRLYLSRATLVVVPSNLVHHWETQIEKHVRSGQLRVYSWSDGRKPCAHNLAWDYDVVITTFSRLSAEWSPRKRSALTEVHWRRVILDEGHTLGSSLALTNKLQMAVSLTASCRWILTGTPTPNTPNDQLSHLQPMLKFVHEEAYGGDLKSWEAGILRPFEAEMEEGRARLLHLLSRCMISARKIDLQMIPPCIKRVIFLNFTEEHARSYNELVVTVRRNILMADWNDPSHVESLLNPKQWKFRSTTIRNVRLSCCVAGHIKVMDAGQDIQETMDILVDNGLDPTSEEYSFIKYNILYGGDCRRCKEWCRLPVITPCRHLLCLDCVALDSERCTLPGCSRLYEMQMPEALARLENPNPKWPVPKDLIELQPSYKQDDWDSDWQSTSSSKVSYLVQRLTSLSVANDTTACSVVARNGSNDFNGPLCSSSISNELLFKTDHHRSSTDYTGKVQVDKVIIFSQFLEHIHVIEQQLSMAGIKFVGMYSPMHSIHKAKSLSIFQQDVNCMALIMDGSAALGLDLSFVTRVFLMEPIWDRSMEEQVISRAHRMGASRPVYVETLAMRGTIEEQMLEFLQDGDECSRVLKEVLVKPEQERTRGHRTLHDFAESNYLARLSFVRTSSRT